MMSGETTSDLGVVEIHSYVRGYHIYIGHLGCTSRTRATVKA